MGTQETAHPPCELEQLLSPWGKAKSNDFSNYHPILYHMADVAHVAHLLYQSILTPSVRRIIAAELGLTESQTGRFISLLAGEHDIGKVSSFQFRSPIVKEILANTELNIVHPDYQPHGVITEYVLSRIDEPCITGWNCGKRLKRALARLTAGHHGRFPKDTQLSLGRNADGGEPWAKIRKNLLFQLTRMFEEAPPIEIKVSDLTEAGLVPIIAGLITVADWIASSEAFFPYEPLQPIHEYPAISRARAEKAVSSVGWKQTIDKVTTHERTAASFEELFGFSPNEMQKTVADIVEVSDCPKLIIIEAAMGEGKTEAALYVVERLLAQGFAQGMYLALPTLATSNAMFDRVRDYLGKKAAQNSVRFNLQLVHSGKLLSDSFEELRMATIDESDEGNVVAEEWFVGQKRSLLAPFGVGTIDQALLGTLQVKHWFVRLFGLAGKVVIVDEVHAYDVYTNELLKNLLSWLRRIGCTVLLLSATLPHEKRGQLLQAWGAVQYSEYCAYPRVTVVQQDRSLTKTFSPPAKKQPVKMTFHKTNPTALAVMIDKELPVTGRAAVICNTVNRAIQVYRTLKRCLEPAEWVVELFHARTLACWRQQTEESVMKHYGKNSSRDGKRILVATQVIEQSIDLDFDWMATDLAPVDLILQRMGRLWRHYRSERPIPFPHLCILADEDADGIVQLPNHRANIYEPYILYRTYLAIRWLEHIDYAADIDRLVQLVYSGEMTPPDQRWDLLMETHRQNMIDRRNELLAQAETVLLPDPKQGARAILRPGNTAEHNDIELIDDDDPKVHRTVRAATRIGDPSILLICVGELEDGTALAPFSACVPDLSQVKELMRFSVSVSSKKIFQAAIDLEPPDEWRSVPMLRHARLVRFERGVAQIGKTSVRLSKQEGLQWNAPDQEVVVDADI
ncbi:CRISPR-associated helicase Cas3' [Heliobacterium undosum]|uniref:CRISPR-associated helicase Cas3 n=1 Tax=Heliomicrobium undosum TaxID=121734 RepID=A0A845L5N1_9FIRM|nr:CRISPR-associated helicase Cas3' [Heliomicrobium undosum]MZP30365.1 CRISPR-associated helicase Cas3' [Heliomicrobium undosum]